MIERCEVMPCWFAPAHLSVNIHPIPRGKSMELTRKQQELKDAYVKARGYWKPWTDGLLRINPDFLETYGRYGGYAAQNGPLTELMCEFIYIALDASATHLFDSGLRTHMNIALSCGATARQIMEVLQLGVAQGLDGTALGVNILVEELRSAGHSLPELENSLDARQLRLKAHYEQRFGDWPLFCDHMLRLDPGHFEAMLDLLTCGVGGEDLDEKSRTLVMLALNASLTELNGDGVRLQIRRALRLGVTHRELLQVLQMVAHVGIHSCSIGVLSLESAMEANQSPPRGS
jgi:alkylhydroperoxidase/carboxymuconolactone decarboxylase family protein YurZ